MTPLPEERLRELYRLEDYDRKIKWIKINYVVIIIMILMVSVYLSLFYQNIIVLDFVVIGYISLRTKWYIDNWNRSKMKKSKN